MAAVTLPAFYCSSPDEQKNQGTNESAWLNVYDTTIHYVGMETCRGCHAEVYNTYIQTGMGQSFDHATKQKSAADFTHAPIYDKELDFYYKPYWQGDSLYIKEYRLTDGDTSHVLVQKIDYIIGSGQHTNSHIFSKNGYLYQAPVTFYTQKKQWDLAPGFEKGSSSRFTRLIESECMTCHNGYPDFVNTSQNKYVSLKTGIDCERCHGPGGLHVKEKMAGNIVDTSKGPDYTIVNPRRLSTELQNNICQRCHLQGIAVLNDGKTFFDFRPGMRLSEVMNVFMPQYEGAEDKMIMASHVERMKKSDCYVSSGKMSCITCHNPHVSVKFTPKTQYINACNNCHGAGKQQCTEKEAVRNTKNNDCITCHMPRNGSIDIPHVAVTDHYIRKRPIDAATKSKITAFLGMQSFNNDNPDAITTARAFMEFYERYNPNKGLIDSVLKYLNKEQAREETEKQNRDYIRAYFLLNDYTKVLQYASALKPEKIQDAWACYRVGEAYNNTKQAAKALPWYKQAVTIWPHSLDFQNKYANCLLTLKQTKQAQDVFTYILSENADHLSANVNIGYIYMQQGNKTMSYNYLMHALQLNPDYEQTLINLAVWHHNNGNDGNAKKYLHHLLKKHPQNEQAKAMLATIN